MGVVMKSMFKDRTNKGSKQKILMDLVQPHLNLPPPNKCGLCFFTVPIMAYIMNGGLSKSFFLNGDIGFWRKPHTHCGFNPSKCFFIFF